MEISATMHPDIKEVLLTQEQIQDIVRQVGARITEDYRDKNPLLVCILRGASVFMADLIRAIDCPLTVDFMAASSYGNSTKSSGILRIDKDLQTPIDGRHVIIVEDILDSGLTLSYLKKNLESRNPASVEIAAFSVKDVAGRTPRLEPKYVGTHVPDAFVVGYGLDYAERYRNLPYLGILKEEVYE
ncbi:MAG: hypoxanthine phosphoribosyltransferase [Atopobiaceae bacterium]|jgi:hypoxanthine phosphoribosyltransferase|nr:hypoxanthine phosphoribosyltransferase [Atopobiaceae bacterium]MCH4119846.1 hypoxanthine phosphoribosyltransferase [Atopobiaceae bacterium]MCI1317744.1 hypoxanthine phosphoribosyltransferase [Atopobiaceae bacterium]MCI1389127.1 hypoxanthine phosphoribosyltransferase [Atopobiaceae bacterium]MCI1432862.1 hypoxanthine phosphoribosyltransferase [Atopobiaceae bacterium]